MTVENLSFSDPHANLQYDEELLQRAEIGGGGEALRFWESPVYFVVLGRTSVAEDDVNLSAAKHDKVPVFRRFSGGGTVLQGPGCLNFTLVLAKTRYPEINSISKSYGYILGQALRALKDLGIDAEFRPVSDLVLKQTEKKFSGNAQRRGRKFILHHGTILYNFDLALVGRYLKMPKRMPEYRRNRTHKDFLTNISVTPNQIFGAFPKEFL